MTLTDRILMIAQQSLREQQYLVGLAFGFLVCVALIWILRRIG